MKTTWSAKPKIQCGAKGDLQFWVHETQSLFVLVFVNYYIIFHINIPTFAPPCIYYLDLYRKCLPIFGLGNRRLDSSTATWQVRSRSRTWTQISLSAFFTQWFFLYKRVGRFQNCWGEASLGAIWIFLPRGLGRQLLPCSPLSSGSSTRNSLLGASPGHGCSAAPPQGHLLLGRHHEFTTSSNPTTIRVDGCPGVCARGPAADRKHSPGAVHQGARTRKVEADQLWNGCLGRGCELPDSRPVWTQGGSRWGDSDIRWGAGQFTYISSNPERLCLRKEWRDDQVVGKQ